MSLTIFIKGIITSVILSSLLLPALATAEKPNVILIMVDDMGYSDIGSFGGEIDTPNIDKLAQQGIKFSQFYNTSRCSSSRASLLTGHYPHQVQMGHLAGKRFQQFDGYQGDLSHDVTTLPEALKSNGYQNYMVGKWHVANYGAKELDTSDISTFKNTPIKRGFDQFYGTLLGGNNYFSPKYLFRNNQAETAKSENYYYTDALSAEAVNFISDHNRKNPYFMYVAYTAPHWPIQAPAKSIKKYRQRYQQGWDNIREARYSKMLSLGLIKSDWQLSAREKGVPAWVDAKDKAWQIERMAVHAAMVDHVDQGIGNIVSTVAKTNELDNTLIIFLSDNGASAEVIPTVYPDFAKAIFDKYTPASGEKTAIGNDVNVMPGAKTTFQTMGLEWANVSNTPFRQHKSKVHEGGIASPLIVSWPVGLKSNANSVVHSPSHVIDIMSTVLDVTKTKAPQGEDKISGISLLPQLHGKAAPQRTLFWEHEGNRAVRDGEWKLVSMFGKPWELYNAANDRTEVHDVASEHPKLVADLERKYQAYAKSQRVTPWETILESIPKKYRRL